MAARRGPLGLLRRLLRLWRVYAYLDLLFMTRDPRSFIGYTIADTALVVASVSATLLLAARFNGIGAWSPPQILFMLGYSIVVNGLVGVLFGYNIVDISRRLGRGQLDHSLIQPQPLWLVLLTEGFTPFSAGAVVLPGLALMLWALADLPSLVTPTWLALLALNLIASTAVWLCFCFLWGSLAFWAPRAAEEISASAGRLLRQLAPYPLDGLAPAMIGLLLTALPSGFIAWYPARALLGLDGPSLAAFGTPLAALALVALTLLAFRRGLDWYGHTGAQRYLDYGHRR